MLSLSLGLYSFLTNSPSNFSSKGCKVSVKKAIYIYSIVL
nr:MAG TPA: RNA-directed RNA polymerase L [Caudoviricetes sp.]DAY99612.1 MAG TPA: RNA-directed RNA polymerase L [Caudoviricetes sp.]